MTDILWVLVQIISPIFGIIYILTISEWRFSRRNTYIFASLYITAVTVINFFLVKSFYPSVETAFELDFAYRVLNNFRVVIVGIIFSRQQKPRLAFSILSVFVCVFFVDTIAITIRTVMGVHLPELLCELSLYPLMFFVIKKFRKPFKEVAAYMQIRMWRFCIVPAVIYLAFFLQVSIPVPLERALHNIPGAIMLCVITVSVYAIIIYLFMTLSVQGNFERNAFAMQIYANALEQQNQISAYNAKMAGIFRHDLRHITQLMLTCLENGDAEGIKELLVTIESNLGSAWKESYMKVISGHKLIDSAFSHYILYAEESGVEMSISLDPMDNVDADITELAVVFANALENALNACKALPQNKEKAIRVIGQRRGKQYFIDISNTYEGDISFNPEIGLPLSNKAGHGLGSQSIDYFVQKFGGELEYSQNGDWFHIRLLLQLSGQ